MEAAGDICSVDLWAGCVSASLLMLIASSQHRGSYPEAYQWAMAQLKLGTL